MSPLLGSACHLGRADVPPSRKTLLPAARCPLPSPGRLAFGASASVQSLQCHAAEFRGRRSRQDFAKGNDTIARLMLVGGVANETGFCYVTGLGWGRRRPLRAWEAMARGVDEGEAGALGDHWRPPGGHAGDGNAMPSRLLPSVNGRPGREWPRWEEKMGSLVMSGEKIASLGCACAGGHLEKKFFFSHLPPPRVLRRKESLGQPAPKTDA